VAAVGEGGDLAAHGAFGSLKDGAARTVESGEVEVVEGLEQRARARIVASG